MRYETLQTLAREKQWAELEREWLATIEGAEAEPAKLLPIIDQVVTSGKSDLADTMGWAWLSMVKERRSPREALQLGRGLLLHLSDGNELREEILSLYKQTHTECPNLPQWIERSGLSSGKSVRRALRYLDTGVYLREGAMLYHRSEDEAAEVEELDVAGDEVRVQTGRRSKTMSIDQLIEDYEVVPENDFRALKQLHPDRIKDLLDKDPATMIIGVLQSHGNRIDRDRLKVLLVPQFLSAGGWSDWWTKLRGAVKSCPNLRIEGRSPMMLIYDPVKQTLEDQTWAEFSKADHPRQWLETLENYLRTMREQKATTQPAFIERVQNALAGHVQRFIGHKEPGKAFATALVIERVAMDGLPISTDVHGKALEMLQKSADPVSLAVSVPDQRLWSLAVQCVRQAFEDRWPELFAEMILYAPASQCDPLAKAIESAGQGERLVGIVDRIVGDPGRYTDGMMWLWNEPAVKTALPTPKPLEVLMSILSLVGPARLSEGRTAGQSINDMRARVRSGLSSGDFGQFRACLENLDEGMTRPLYGQIDRADGLGPASRDKMLAIMRERFPKMHAQARRQLEVWEDDAVLYFSERGLKALEAHRDEIVNIKMRENAKAIGAAAEHGDLSENSEYKFALEERDLLRARLAQVNRELSLAKLLSSAEVPNDRVSIGQRLTLQAMPAGESLVITIGGHGETDLGQRVYSYQTPLAGRLLGKRPGDTAMLSLEADEVEYRIERIENAFAPA